MRIGIDFDNTIVCYDQLFHKVAVERSLIPPGLTINKVAVRNYLRENGKEDLWTEMQGYVYGSRMCEALAYPDVIDTITFLQEEGHDVFVVSHKTHHPFAGPKYDLHQAATSWINNHLLRNNSPLLSEQHLFFELTKQEKIDRIKDLGCDLFVDDLPEILMAPEFPSCVRKILFDSENNHPEAGELGLIRVNDWLGIRSFMESADNA